MYQNFIGIDIGKSDFFIALHGQKKVNSYTNDDKGFMEFEKKYHQDLSTSLVILETTGGYEKALIRFLQAKDHAVHRANTKKVKHFIRSYGQLGKSDTIDSLALANYGYERHSSLALYAENKGEMLRKLVCRRNDLKQLIVKEKNRLQAPEHTVVK